MATGLGESDLSEPEVELTLGLSIGGINRTASVPPPAATAGQSLRRSDSAGEQREMHALRRHEARRKLEEKQRRKGGLCRGGSATAALPTGFGFLSAEERAALEAQQRQIRARGRDGESRETDSISPRWPPSRKQEGVEIPNFPAVMPMRYRFPQVQYLPVVNGFGIPCMMPCWAPAISAAAAATGNGSNKPDCNVYHPVAAAGNGSNKPDCNVYHPVAAAANMQSKGFCARKGIAAVMPARQSKDSASSSTSGISAQAGSKNSSSSNSDARSNSNHIAKKSASIQATDEKLGSGTDNTLTLVPRKLEEANSVNKPISEETETKLRRPTPLPRMPCVSATGDGPHGKTITGVLYKYEKSEEVSILCVCHGSSFSPAEFVKHAGGIETAYPMRQIVVVPS